MSWSGSLKEWLRLPSRIALLLGFGALSATGAQADAAEIERGNQSAWVPQQSAKTFGDLAIWSDGGRIYLAEAGKPARELRLGDTAEARHLRDLLNRDRAVANSPRQLQDRIILVGGGGTGMSWTPAERNRAFERPREPAATGFRPNAPKAPAQTVRPENSGVPGKASTTRIPEKG
jgi:hypothetical protein